MIGYYEPRWLVRNIFENNQSELENATERLSNMIESEEIIKWCEENERVLMINQTNMVPPRYPSSSAPFPLLAPPCSLPILRCPQSSPTCRQSTALTWARVSQVRTRLNHLFVALEEWKATHQDTDQVDLRPATLNGSPHFLLRGKAERGRKGLRLTAEWGQDNEEAAGAGGDEAASAHKEVKEAEDEEMAANKHRKVSAQVCSLPCVA